MKNVVLCLALLISTSAVAEVIVPARTIRARAIISAEDLIRKPVDISGALSDLRAIVGQEARVVLYAGRPIRPGDVGPPAIISRNDLVVLVFARGPLRIATEGRALGRGAVGETVRAMNMASRMTVTGTIMPNGSIEVQ